MGVSGITSRVITSHSQRGREGETPSRLVAPDHRPSSASGWERQTCPTGGGGGGTLNRREGNLSEIPFLLAVCDREGPQEIFVRTHTHNGRGRKKRLCSRHATHVTSMYQHGHEQHASAAHTRAHTEPAGGFVFLHTAEGRLTHSASLQGVSGMN